MKRVWLLFFLALLLFGFGQAAQAAPVSAPIIGEIQRLTIDTPADHWSGGKMVVDGATIILPRNLLIDLPANRLTLKQIFDQAPAACVAAGESGLAKADTCNASGAGGNVSLFANVTNGGNTIAGDVFIQKGLESVTGVITYINHTDGYFRIGGVVGDASTGIMVRLNDPTGRHTVQQGLGCLPGAQNCSADPRFTLDPDNYVIVATTGYPICIPSTVPRTFVDVLGLGTTTAQGLADGTGDVLCPATNRTIANGLPVDDSRRFAPLRLGDSITADGNFETIDCVRFVSAHTMKVNVALTTKNLPGQPDYMFIDEAFIDAPGFQNKRARSLFIGYTTLAPADVLIWSIHRDPTTNAAHELPLGTTTGCDLAGGALTCTGQGIIPGGGDIFRIRHDVDFLVGAKPKLDPCAHLLNDARMGTGFCGGVVNELNIRDMFAILSPVPHEIQARTGHNLANPGLITLDVKGVQATNGQYLFPFGGNLGGIDFPNFFEINIGLVSTPYSFSGIPWNLDRRLSPGGCNGACEGAPQPLSPFPFEGLAMDPRLQDPNLPHTLYTDRNFTSADLTDVSNRILSYVPGGGTKFGGNATVLAWPPADPAAIPITVVPPIAPRPAVVSITSVPVVTGKVTQPYIYQVTAVNAGTCGALTYTLDVAPTGMTIDASGTVRWTPTPAQIGPFSVIVRAAEPGGAFDTQAFGIAVVGLVPGVTKPAPNDFDGDGRTDFTVWRSVNGAWFILRSFDRGLTIQQFGDPSDNVVPGDYDGDGKTDIAVWRPSNGAWFIINSSTGAMTIKQFGDPTDIPVPGDYNGDGKMDIAVWRPANGAWFIIDSSSNAVTIKQWGDPTDLPVPGDYDGDGKADIAVWRPANGAWFIINSSTGAQTIKQWGDPTDKPVPADYTGDGKTDIAVWRPADGNWYIIDSTSNAMVIKQLGALTDKPVPGDYDGDGKADYAVYSTTGIWNVILSSFGLAGSLTWGGDPTDVPITYGVR